MLEKFISSITAEDIERLEYFKKLLNEIIEKMAEAKKLAQELFR
jgi:hypothetical protein